MGSPDIRIKVGTPRHLKFRRLRKRLGPGACWAWLTLACYVGENRSSGDLGGLSDIDIAEAAEYDGDAKEFVDALVDTGLLEREGAQVYMHDWSDHNPWAAGSEDRSESARAAANARWKKHAGRNAESCESDAPHKPHMRPDAPAETRICPVSLPTPTPTPPTPTPPAHVCEEEGAGRHEEIGPDIYTTQIEQALTSAWEADPRLLGQVGDVREVRRWIRANTIEVTPAKIVGLIAGIRAYQHSEELDRLSPTTLERFLWKGRYKAVFAKAGQTEAPKPPGKPRLKDLVDLAIVRKLTNFDVEAWGNAKPLEDERGRNPEEWKEASREAERRIRAVKAEGRDAKEALPA